MSKSPADKRFWQVKAAGRGVGEVYIYGDIVSEKWADSDVSAADFAEALKVLGDVSRLEIHINSCGGSVFEGQAIYSILRQHAAEKHVYIDGIAASIASLVAMAGDTVYAPANAMLMIHNPWGYAIGTAEELRRKADALDRIREAMIPAYMRRLAGRTEEARLTQMLDAETWLTAHEAAEYGFVDQVLEEKQIAASASPEMRKQYLLRYANMPDAVQAALEGHAEPARPGPSDQGLAAADSLRRSVIDDCKATQQDLADRFILVR